jgi:transposase InsO family protein
MRYGSPTSLVSDRGSVFTSEYWQSFCYNLAIKRRMSTAFHPQTDGQTERQNQQLEAYLRMYCTWEQNDWAERLPEAMYAHNSKVHQSTQQTPLSLIGANDVIPDTVPGPEPAKGEDSVTSAERARSWLEKQRQRIVEAGERLEASAAAQKKYYDRARSDRSFEAGEQVLLKAQNIRTKRPHRKLDDKWLGPFTIRERVGLNAYRLVLPESIKRLHPVFNVQLLEPYKKRDGYNPPPVNELEVVEGDAEAQWEVEKILSRRQTAGKPTQYLVRWLGYSSSHDEWKGEAELDSCQDLLQEYLASQKARG